MFYAQPFQFLPIPANLAAQNAQIALSLGVLAIQGVRVPIGMIDQFFKPIRPHFIFLLVAALLWPAGVHAYAVLSHEAIIDAAWETHIKPLLLKKFPQASEEDLSRAQGYAYGGAIFQNMGYYPIGSPFFSALPP